MSENVLSPCSPLTSPFAQPGTQGDVHTQKVLTSHARRLAKLADRHECFLDKVTYSLGVLSFGLVCYLLGSCPQVIPHLYCLFYISAVPLRWLYYRTKKWHYYLLDFCYYANAIFVSMLLFFPANSRLFLLCFSLSQGPLAWALIVWRCSLVFSSVDKIISVLIHLLPGTVFFVLRWWDSNTLLLADVAEDTLFNRWPVVHSIPTLWVWLFVVPLMVYCVWQGLYFLVVEGLQRRRILQDPEIMTSYKELKRKAERANNIWWHLSGLLGEENRVYMYAIIQGIFTIATLAFTVLIFKSYRLHVCFEMFKLAVTAWNGGKYVSEVMPQHAVKKLKNDGYVQMAARKRSCNTNGYESSPASLDGHAKAVRKEMPEKFGTKTMEVCQLCKMPRDGDRIHVPGEHRGTESSTSAAQFLRSMLEKQINRGKQNERCDSLDQRGSEWNRQVACAS